METIECIVENVATFTISHVSRQAPKDVQMDQKDGHEDPKRWAGVFITKKHNKKKINK